MPATLLQGLVEVAASHQCRWGGVVWRCVTVKGRLLTVYCLLMQLARNATTTLAQTRMRRPMMKNLPWKSVSFLPGPTASARYTLTDTQPFSIVVIPGQHVMFTRLLERCKHYGTMSTHTHTHTSFLIQALVCVTPPGRCTAARSTWRPRVT